MITQLQALTPLQLSQIPAIPAFNAQLPPQSAAPSLSRRLRDEFLGLLTGNPVFGKNAPAAHKQFSGLFGLDPSQYPVAPAPVLNQGFVNFPSQIMGFPSNAFPGAVQALRPIVNPFGVPGG